MNFLLPVPFDDKKSNATIIQNAKYLASLFSLRKGPLCAAENSECIYVNFSDHNFYHMVAFPTNSADPAPVSKYAKLLVPSIGPSTS